MAHYLRLLPKFAILSSPGERKFSFLCRTISFLPFVFHTLIVINEWHRFQQFLYNLNRLYEGHRKGRKHDNKNTPGVRRTSKAFHDEKEKKIITGEWKIFPFLSLLSFLYPFILQLCFILSYLLSLFSASLLWKPAG